MKIIVFKTLNAKGDIKTLGTARMKNGKVTIAFKEARVQKNLELGSVIGDGGHAFTPEDGVDYLLSLPVAFSGSRLWAEVEDQECKSSRLRAAIVTA
ncbi:MAG TPA: hypothetical protein VMV90_00350 [Rectinemataceae bacterium]|nr:hypothetical protein [Rectinemataceae bacterium]